MSVLIKGMEMPENCIECPLRKGTVCDAFQLIQPYTFKDNERAAFCPMTEVPEPKTGEWIAKSEHYRWMRKCSVCGWMQEIDTPKMRGWVYRYCHNCGKDMRGEEE